MNKNLEKFEMLSIHDFLAKSSDQKLIVHTAAGIYIGDSYDPEDEEHEHVTPLIQRIKDFRISEYDKDNPTAFVLVNVELHNSTFEEPFKLPYVLLFIDQVLGISIGRFDPSVEE